jgi:hypothetical protein
MRLLKTGLVIGALAGALLSNPAVARAAIGVVFVHGTSDQSQSSALNSYWTQGGVDSMRNGEPYLVVGYPGASCAGYSQCSWGPIVDQITSWMNANSITSFTVITHSKARTATRWPTW